MTPSPPEPRPEHSRFAPRIKYKGRETEIVADGWAAVVLAAALCSPILIATFKLLL